MDCNVTFGMIKPDAVSAGNVGGIVSMIEKSELSIIGMKVTRLSTDQAELFYAAHSQKPFYRDLVNFMLSGKVIALALQGTDAVSQWRSLIGNTNPTKAEEGTIRRAFGESIERNAVHGADSPDAANKELQFFFGDIQPNLVSGCCVKVS